MKRSFRLLLVCGLTLGSGACDRPEKETAAPSPGTTLQRPARPPRPDDDGPEITRSGLRESLDHATGLSAPKDRDQALEAVIEDAMELDPELAREAFDQLTPASPIRERMVEHFAMRLAEQNLDSAIQWAGSLATDEEQSRAFGNVALVLSSDDPQAAAKLLSDSGVASRDFDVAVVQVIQRWAEKSPADAAAWVLQFDPGEARSASLKEIASAWIDQDATAAYAWISSIPDPTIREEAINGMAESILDRPDAEQSLLLQSGSKEIRHRHEQLKAMADEELNEID